VVDKPVIGIQKEPLDLGLLHQALGDEEAGGICVFVGTARRWTGDLETELLAYEAFEPMAVTELERLAREAAARWPVRRVVLVHRLGVVMIGEAAVFVGVACPHRAEAFEACRWLIDTLKRDVPIWKRETLADGSKTWVDG
jgi:molybdopterin synthase catalytic subunit